MAIQYIKKNIKGTQTYLIKAPILEYKIIITEPKNGDTLLETTTNFAKRYGAEAAINSNFFSWIHSGQFKNTWDIIAWAALGSTENCPIKASKLRETLGGKLSIYSEVFSPYYYQGKEIKKYLTGGLLNYQESGGCDYYTTKPSDIYNTVQPINLLINYGINTGVKGGSDYPKTIFGRTKDEYIFFVSDGRGNGGSPGLDYEEVTEYLLKHGVTLAVATDGGESSSLVYKNKLVNRPQDRYCALSQLFSHRFILGALKLTGIIASERPVGLNIGLIKK